MANKYPVLLFQLVSMFIIMISCLHTSHSMHRQATDLKSLLAQQNSFEEQVNAIVTNLATVEAKTKATDNNTEKVLILEKTIVS